ncbi:MAG: hypothetical protein O7A08_11215 [SAR324 cluster bacterium]|nr:hypothetical protein [SAR324 cluster bacterium]
MTRCFLAFEFAPRSLAYLQEYLPPAHRLLAEERGWPLRLIRPENWHVTLLFFNDLAEEERARVWAETERAAREGTWRGLAFAWMGLSLWPNPRRPSLICLEAERYSGSAAWPLPLSQQPFCKGEVGHLLAYRPHATVMRLRGRGRKGLGKEWHGLAGDLPRFDAARIRLDRLSFFLSTLSAAQPVYAREYTVGLD